MHFGAGGTGEDCGWFPHLPESQMASRPRKGENLMKRILIVVALILLLSSLSYGKEEPGKANKFDRAEYMPATVTGQKKAVPAVKGTLSFETEKKSVDFLDQKSALAFSIRYDAIKSLLYENTSQPRYAAAILISPLFLLSHSKQHFLTIQYTGADGTGQFVIVHLDKKNAQEAVAAAEAQTGKTVEHVEEK
jgi:hypothetical protein